MTTAGGLVFIIIAIHGFRQVWSYCDTSFNIRLIFTLLAAFSSGERDHFCHTLDGKLLTEEGLWRDFVLQGDSALVNDWARVSASWCNVHCESTEGSCSVSICGSPSMRFSIQLLAVLNSCLFQWLCSTALMERSTGPGRQTRLWM